MMIRRRARLARAESMQDARALRVLRHRKTLLENPAPAHPLTDPRPSQGLHTHASSFGRSPALWR